MKLSQLQYFCAVCEHRNITRAAEALHISQPSLSYAMRELEAEFGTPLLLRRGRGVEPTGAGEALLARAKPLLEQARELSDEMIRLAGTRRERVKVGVAPMLGSIVLPQLLQRMGRDCPGVALELAENGSERNRELVAGGELDAAVISCEPGDPAPPGTRALTLGRVEVLLYLPAGHPLSAKAAVDPRETVGLPLALLGEGSFINGAVERLYRGLGAVPQVALRTNQLQMIRRLIQSGDAAAFLFREALDLDDSIAAVPLLPPCFAEVRLLWGRNTGPGFGQWLSFIRSHGELWPR